MTHPHNNKQHRFPLLPLALAQLLLLTSCYQMVQSKLEIDTETPSSSFSDFFKEDLKITQLEPPEQIFASEKLYSDTIYVSWSPVLGAASYRLERAVLTDLEKERPDDEDFALIPATKNSLATSAFITDNFFVDVILENPEYTAEEYNYRYFYRVSAENATAKYESSEFIVTEKSSLFAPPTNVVADGGKSQTEIGVSWKKTEGATSYRIYRTTDVNGYNSVLIASVSAATDSYDNIVSQSEQGIDFYYTVTAVNANGHESVKSGQALGYALQKGAPGQVTGVKVTAGRGDTTDKISIEWESMVVAGEEILYAIYRTSSTDSAYNLVAKGLKNASYTDSKSLKPNTYYYYQVMAYVEKDGEEIKGQLSASSATDKEPAEGYLLSPPSEIGVSKNGDKCTIKFAAAIGEEGSPLDSGLLDDYNEYSYKIFSGDNIDAITTEESFELGVKTDGYYSVTVGAKSYYKLQTVNGTFESRQSEIVAPAPAAATDVSATQRAKIDGYTDNESQANSSGVYPVKITWSAPSGGASGGYHIYRSTTPDSGFRKITETPVMETSYIDKNDVGKAGIYYYYKVLSLNSFSQGANLSSYAKGYGAITHNQYMREYNKTIMMSQKKLTLMHKSPDTAKLGKETINGDISGTLVYDAGMAGLGARITMHYENYADCYVGETQDVYFNVTGDTNTTASMDASGKMDGTVVCTGMYPGTVGYDKIEIKGGNAGGGVYVITIDGFGQKDVSYTVGNEGRK